MSNSSAEKQILKLNDRLSRDITISLTKSEHPSYPLFEDFCDNLNRLVPGVKIAKDGDNPELTEELEAKIKTALKDKSL